MLLCKTNIIRFFPLLLGISFLLGCSETTTPDQSSDRFALVSGLLEDPQATFYNFYANDSMPGDSVKAHLGSGVIVSTQPGAQYELELASTTEMELNLFELSGESIKKSPLIYSGRCDGQWCRFTFSGTGASVRW